MVKLLRILNSLPVFWLFLSVPAMIFSWQWASGDTIAMDLLHPTGEFSARFMIVAMAISPLVVLFGKKRWTDWLLRRRRSFGLAAFGYALLHLIFYVIDMGALEPILAEIGAPAIWTGWIAFFLFVPLAVTSSDRAMRQLGRRWKQLQRLVYFAAVLTLVHWLLIHDGAIAAWAHFVPLAAIQLLRGIIIYGRAKSKAAPTLS